MRFNINHHVKIKLTDKGREIIHKSNAKLLRAFPNAKLGLPKEDSEGWSTWQFWHVMDMFGEHVSLGKESPFDTEIEIIDERRTISNG